MKKLLSIVALLGLTGLGMNLSAQQPASPSAQDPAAQQTPATPSATPSTPSPSTQDPTAAQQPSTQPTDATNAQQSARSFEGKISKSGDKMVLKESATQTSYQLDDQDKAKQFEGKNVKVMATLDASTNTLHIVDISPSESR